MRDSIRVTRIRYTLIFIILATIPCYCVGLIFVRIANSRNQRPTITPTFFTYPTITLPSTGTQTDLQSITDTPVFPTATPNPEMTAKASQTPSITPTPFLPFTDTPTLTPSISPTITPSETPSPTETTTPTETGTPTPTDTPTLTPTQTETPTNFPTVDITITRLPPTVYVTPVFTPTSTATSSP